MSNWNQEFGPEAVIVHNFHTKVQVRVPAHPKCEYVRVVMTEARAENDVTGEVLEGECELMYWDQAEWFEDPEGVMGEIMAVTMRANGGDTFEVEFGYKAFE